MTDGEAQGDLRAKYPPPPGRLVDVGGYRLHIDCLGEGSPAVVMEAGTWDFGLTWARVQPGIAEFSRACVYDRAGLGWSDASPRRRTVEAMVEELHTLLANAGLAPPYVLVGQSFGGLVVRLFAHQHPDEVVGMVLVDSAHEDQYLRAPEAIRNAWPTIRSHELAQLDGMRSLIASGMLDPAHIPVPAKLPEPATEAYRALLAADTRTIDTMVAEAMALEESQAQVRAAGIVSLGDIPLVVLSHGEPLPPFPPELGIPSQAMQEYEQVWQQMQTELAALSPRGRRLAVPESGHMIHHDRPELVVDEIREVVSMARA